MTNDVNAYSQLAVSADGKTLATVPDHHGLRSRLLQRRRRGDDVEYAARITPSHGMDG